MRQTHFIDAIAEPGGTLVELCAGTASVSLWALGRVRPLTGYMGSKRRDVYALTAALGARSPDHVHLVDAGPWGDVWSTLQHAEGRRGTSAILREWDARGSLPDVWPTLLYEPPADAAERAAQYLCLQARAAGCIPVWWSETAGRWESPSGSRTESAHQRGGCGLATRMKPCGRKVGKAYRSHPARGLVRIATLARRVDALGCIDWSRVTVHHCDVGDVAPIPGAAVYFDPPYAGAPRYACLLPRQRVLDICRSWAEAARLVVVSEAEPLPLDGWPSYRLRPTGKPEWITCSAPILDHGWANLALDTSCH